MTLHWRFSRSIFPSLDDLHKITRGAIIHLEQCTVIDGVSGHSLAEQLDALDDGWQPSKCWAEMVRDVQLWQDETAIPLRLRQVAEMEVARRLHSPDYSHIVAILPEGKVLGAEPRFATYYSSLDESKHRYAPDLYEAFASPGGARDVLLTDAEGQLLDASTFYCRDVRRTHDDAAMDPASLLRALRRVIRRAAEVLPTLSVSEESITSFGWLMFRRAHGIAAVRAGIDDREVVRSLIGTTPVSLRIRYGRP